VLSAVRVDTGAPNIGRIGFKVSVQGSRVRKVIKVVASLVIGEWIKGNSAVQSDYISGELGIAEGTKFTNGHDATVTPGDGRTTNEEFKASSSSNASPISNALRKTESSSLRKASSCWSLRTEVDYRTTHTSPG
jgi:hypothetical protein